MKYMLTDEKCCAIICRSRGISAVGSAQHWQCWGHGFESRMLHQNQNLSKKRMALIGRFLYYFNLFITIRLFIIEKQNFKDDNKVDLQLNM